MIKVAGLWEQGWNTPFLEADLWEYPLRDFGVFQHYMCPVSGIDRSKISERKSLDIVLEENKDLVIVWVDELGETPLSEFNHPENVLYILGRTTSQPMTQFGRPEDYSVRIETHSDGSNRGMLWAHQAVSIVLYDRLKKSWQ